MMLISPLLLRSNAGRLCSRGGEFTGEAIREIPAFEVLDLAANLGEMVGIVFDQEG
jgi:hypothetical protein